MRIQMKARGFAVAALLAMTVPFAAQADGHTDAYTGAKGYVGEKGYVDETAARPVSNQHYGDSKLNGSQPKRFYSSVRLAVPGCPEGFNGMYRGTLYCVDGRPIH